jgi:AcrR family transcriptional regulator
MNPSQNSLRSRQQQQTRTEIVRTAFDLFGKHGFDGVSVEMIAETVGISRATFFNYFPRKELILREVASARAEKLKSIVAEFRTQGEPHSLEGVMNLVLKLTEENARISHHAKKLLLETFVSQASQGLLLVAREEVIHSLAGAIEQIPRKSAMPAKLVAETIFAVYLATMLEWLMREGVPREWLIERMHERLQLVLEGAA